MTKAGGARDQGPRSRPAARAQAPPTPSSPWFPAPTVRRWGVRTRDPDVSARGGGGSAGPREKQAQPHGSPAVQRLRPPPRGRARPSRPSSWRRSRAPTTRRPSRRATCASSCRRRPAWTCASCRSAFRAAHGRHAAQLASPAPRPLTGTFSPGVVPEPPGQGKETQEGRGPAALGPVFPKHEARPRRLQVGQGQRAGGGAGQRRRGLLHRYWRATRTASQSRGSPSRKEVGLVGCKEPRIGISKSVASLAYFLKVLFVDPRPHPQALRAGHSGPLLFSGWGRTPVSQLPAFSRGRGHTCCLASRPGDL